MVINKIDMTDQPTLEAKIREWQQVFPGCRYHPGFGPAESQPAVHLQIRSCLNYLKVRLFMIKMP